MQPIRTIAVVSVLALTGYVFWAADAAIAQGVTDEQQLIQLERDWCNAELNKDAPTLDRILADDFAGVGGNGIIQTKADALANLTDSANTTTTCVDTSIKVRIYGDAAVVTGMGTRAGNYTSFRDRHMLWTDTFIKKGGHWECVASQGTWIATPQP